MDHIAEKLSYKEKVRDTYKKYERYRDPGIFVAGFVFDLFTVSRIDDLLSILQQAAYLFIISIMISLEIYDQYNPFNWRPKIQKVWSYRNFIMHFFFGSLLSAYAIFYFKSASLVTSFAFLGFMVTLLVANEFSRVQSSGPLMRMGLLSLCLVSYFGYLVPIIFGHTGPIPFILAQSLTIAYHAGIFFYLKKKLGPHVTSFKPLAQVVLLPCLLVQGIFLGLYMTSLIPPVPLSAQYMGIYHSVQKDNDQYELGYTRSFWKFWQNGDQTFASRPGDKIVLFTRLFSPARFKEDINIRWQFKNVKGNWETHDVIPLKISGGRDEGFRGYAYKGNYSLGSWRVQLETQDKREISRVYFDVIEDTSLEERDFRFDVQ
ncbi:MAG: DUF2914 domain-containing protein [Pseudomonadota bacterium]|nr:DUF2914 domain-containing protein [Pseudomonadota bacterium]